MDLKTLGVQLSRSEQLPVLPQIAVAVLRMAANQDANANRLERVLEQDAGLAARVLKVANSVYYGMPTKARSISAAIQLLGMRSLQSIVISVAYHQAINKQERASEFNRVAFWRHGLAVGSIAKRIAQHAEPDLMEEFYTIGLIHDIGMLVLASFCPEEFGKVLSVSKLGVVPQEMVEQHVFGYDSSDVGALLAEKWMFGSMAEAAVKNHLLKSGQEFPKATGIIALANALAHEAGMTNQSGPYELKPPPWAMEVAGLSQEVLAAIRADITQVIFLAEDTYQIAHQKSKAA